MMSFYCLLCWSFSLSQTTPLIRVVFRSILVFSLVWWRLSCHCSLCFLLLIVIDPRCVHTAITRRRQLMCIVAVVVLISGFLQTAIRMCIGECGCLCICLFLAFLLFRVLQAQSTTTSKNKSCFLVFFSSFCSLCGPVCLCFFRCAWRCCRSACTPPPPMSTYDDVLRTDQARSA